MFSRIIHKIRRLFTTRNLYIYPETSDGWMKCSDILFDSHGKTYFDPYYCAENHSLYISNRDDNNITCFKIDSNFHLVNEVVVFTGVDGAWDHFVNRACVIYHNGTYYMWYTGQQGGSSKIGFAKSYDGISFERNSEAVLYSTEHYEKNSVMNPCVIFDEKSNVFKMWYSAGDIYEPDVICYAESKDGILWKKRSDPVFFKSENEYDKYKVGGCEIVKNNDGYLMYYIGYQNLDNARICCAKSYDGYNWERIENNPIISPSKAGRDAHACYKPAYFVDSNNVERLYYNGRKRGFETILLAKRD